MNRLTIKWDTDVAAEALRRMRSSDAGLSESLIAARSAHQTLDEACPDDSSRALNLLLAEFDATVESLAATQRSLQDLIDKAETANRNFEAAANEVDHLIDNLVTDGGRIIPVVLHGYAPEITMPGSPWNPNPPIIMPSIRNTGTFTPTWLEAVVNETDLSQI